MLKSGMNNLWPNPVFLGEIEQQTLLDETIQSIFEFVDLDRPTGDFQEFDPLHDGPSKLKDFRDRVVYPAFENYMNKLGYDIGDFEDARLKSWITGVRNGYMIPAHNHSGASFSAVFYLLCHSETNHGGELVLQDPRSNANRGYKNPFKPMFENSVFAPASGEYVIFPSYLYHHTMAYTGKMRLAMPVDLFL